MLLPFILETANAPGTGAFALLGPATGRKAFYPAFASGSVVMYRADDGAGNWEEGWGVSASGSPNNTLTRNVERNSAGTTSPLNFTGAVDVYCDMLTGRVPYLNNAGDLVAGVPATRLTGSATVNLSSAPSIPNLTQTVVSWSLGTDDLGFYSAGQPTRLTVPTGVARVRLTWQLAWAGNATGFRRGWARKNGTVFDLPGLPASTVPSVGPGDIPFHGAAGAILAVTPGDYFELVAYQNSGGALSLHSAPLNSWFSIERVP